MCGSQVAFGQGRFPPNPPRKYFLDLPGFRGQFGGPLALHGGSPIVPLWANRQCVYEPGPVGPLFMTRNRGPARLGQDPGRIQTCLGPGLGLGCLWAQALMSLSPMGPSTKARAGLHYLLTLQQGPHRSRLIHTGPIGPQRGNRQPTKPRGGSPLTPGNGENPRKTIF